MATQEQTATSFVSSSSPPSVHNSVYQNGVHQPHYVVKSSISAVAGDSHSAVDATAANPGSKLHWSQEQQPQSNSLQTYVNGAGSLAEQRRQQHLTSSVAAPVGNYYQQNSSWRSPLPAAQQPQHQQQPPPTRQQLEHEQQQDRYQEQQAQQPQQHRTQPFEPPQQQQHHNSWGGAYSSSATGALSGGAGSQMQRVHRGGAAAAAAPAAAASSVPSSSFSVPASPGGVPPRHISAATSRNPLGDVSGAGDASGVYFRGGGSIGGTAAGGAPLSSSTSNVWQSPFGAAGGGQGSLVRGNLVSGNSNVNISSSASSVHPSSASLEPGAMATGGYLQERENVGFTASKMSVFTAAAGAAAVGAAAAGGAGGGDMQRVVMEAMLSSVRENFSSEAAERVSQLQKWFPSLISTLRPYFCVTQTSVRKRLLQLLFPFSALLPQRRKNSHASSFENLQAAAPADCSGADYSSGSIHVDGGESSSSRNAAAGGRGAVGNAFARDLYTPSMALITYVLLYALSRADDFQPELLGSTISLALLLLAAEVLAAKLALYCVGAPSVHTLDLFSFCGYKYVNLVIILLFRLLVEALASAGAGVPLSPAFFPSSSSASAVAPVQSGSSSLGSESAGGDAGFAATAGLAGAAGDVAETAAAGGAAPGNSPAADAAAAAAKPAMRALALLSAVPPTILERNTWLYTFHAVYVYMCVCAAAEVIVLLRAAAAAASEKAAAAAAWGGSSYRSSRAQQYVYGGLALAQIPLCWLLMPSFSRHKKGA